MARRKVGEYRGGWGRGQGGIWQEDRKTIGEMAGRECDER